MIFIDKILKKSKTYIHGFNKYNQWLTMIYILEIYKIINIIINERYLKIMGNMTNL